MGIRIVPWWLFRHVIIQLIIMTALINVSAASVERERLRKSDVDSILQSHKQYVSSSPGGFGSPADFSNYLIADLDLSGYDFEGMSFRNAYIENCTLTGANFKSADLYKTKLIKVKINDVKFEYANLSNVVYHPSEFEVDVESISQAENLQYMSWTNDSRALQYLLTEFKKKGYLKQERQILHAVKHNNDSVKFDSYIVTSLLGFPTGWGMSPLRPLQFLCINIFLFSLLNFFPVLNSSKKWGIMKTLEDGQEIVLKGKQNLFYSFYFSLVSGLRFGWQPLKNGTWLSRMQPNEYTLIPYGWWRLITGFHGIICNYLITIFLLNYFGGLFR